MAKISALTALASGHATGDLLDIVDISDTTMAATGTNKKTTLTAFFANLPCPALTTLDGTASNVMFGRQANTGMYFPGTNQVSLACNGISWNYSSSAFTFGGSTGTGVLGSTAAQWKQIYFDFTNTGTVGAVTINKASGRVNIAAAGTSVVVTNSLVTAASKVFVVCSTNDTTARVNSVVPAAGSFTINTPACTAQTSFDFFVVNVD